MSALTREQLDELSRRLADRRNELRQELHDELVDSGDERYAELANAVHDLGEESIATLFADVNISLMNRHIREIETIERAQRRMEHGSYGKCIDCGRDIGFERLQRQPDAERCIDCQKRFETVYAHEETPRW